jgi:hypothetical protein
VDTFSVVQGVLLGCLELVGITIALALCVSDRRARTDTGHYFYSPTSNPSSVMLEADARKTWTSERTILQT